MRALGFADVVWTLYNFRGTDEEVLRWIAHMDLYALAMFQERAEQQLPALARQKTGVLTWIHTVNSVEGLTDALNTGAAEIMTDSMPAVETDHVSVTASGFGAGESYIVGINSTQQTMLQRGVNLISLDDPRNPVVLARYDGCGVLLSGEVPDPQPFVSALAEARVEFETLAVVVHDSAFCGEVTLEPVLAESGLETWSQIGFRQPYIAFMSGDQPPTEHLGDASTQISRVWVVPEAD
jgi:hypothetical protein